MSFSHARTPTARLGYAFDELSHIYCAQLLGASFRTYLNLIPLTPRQHLAARVLASITMVHIFVELTQCGALNLEKVSLPCTFELFVLVNLLFTVGTGLLLARSLLVHAWWA